MPDCPSYGTVPDHQRSSSYAQPAVYAMAAPKKVLFATPSYDGNCCMEHRDSLLRTDRLCRARGIELIPAAVVHFSDVGVARRELLCAMLRTDATDFFFVDADTGWDPDGFMRVLMSDKNFIVGACPIKIQGKTDQYRIVLDANEDGTPAVDPGDGTISVQMVGCAFMRLTRAAIIALIESYAHEEGLMPQLFARMENPQGEAYGEDYSFCKKWLAIGGKIWLVPNINFTHVGTARWTGNYEKFLLSLRGGA